MGWHELQQYERNHKILDRAREDVGKYVGVKCHEWVRNILIDASDGAIQIPQDAWIPEDIPNNALEEVECLCSRQIAINAMQMGECIQMEIAFLDGVPGKHSAIAEDIEEDGITFIENNWDPPFEKTVSRRKILFSKFAKQVNKFTIYRVL